jgi:hypothetical protein
VIYRCALTPLTTPTSRCQRRVIDYFFPSVSVVCANDLCHSMANQESLECNTQVRCRHCATGWVFLNSQEDVPTPSQKKCEACLRKSNSHRAERLAQDPKPIGGPPKQVSKKSNRGRKSDLRDRLGDSLHATAHINVANKDDDDDELAAQPPVSKPVTQPWGRPRERARGPSPTQRPNAGRRKTAEPSPGLPTRLSIRHTRRGSELAPPPKRLKPPHDVMSSLAV